jgi:mRNA interferase RelE/StbE
MASKIEFHPAAAKEFDALDGGVKKEVASKIDALTENPFLGRPLGVRGNVNLTGFYKLYVAKKTYRIVYRLIGREIEIVEIIGIGKRDKQQIYKLVVRRVDALKKRKK